MGSEKFGYVRVSTKEQNTDRQLKKMHELAIKEVNIFEEKKSGKNFDRPLYQEMRGKLREGDLLYLDSLDRLGRDYDGIIAEWKYITRELNADIIVLEHESLFDSRKYKTMERGIGKLMEDQLLGLLAYVAESERLKKRIQQREGIDAAQAKGKKFGRPKVKITEAFRKTYQEFVAGNISAQDFMRLQGMKKNTFYRRVDELKKELDGGI